MKTNITVILGLILCFLPLQGETPCNKLLNAAEEESRAIVNDARLTANQKKIKLQEKLAEIDACFRDSGEDMTIQMRVEMEKAIIKSLIWEIHKPSGNDKLSSFWKEPAYFDKLTGRSCLETLKHYRDTVDQLRKENKLDEEAQFSQELMVYLWGLLYRISRYEVLIEEGEEVLRDILFPRQPSPFENLIVVMEEAAKDPEKMIEFLKELKDFTGDEQANLMKFVIAFTRNYKKGTESDEYKKYQLEEVTDFFNDTDQVQNFFKEVRKLDDTGREALISFLLDSIDFFNKEKDKPENQQQMFRMVLKMLREEDENELAFLSDLIRLSEKSDSPQQQNLLIDKLYNLLPQNQFEGIQELMEDYKKIESREVPVINVGNFWSTSRLEGEDLERAEILLSTFEDVFKEEYFLEASSKDQPLFFVEGNFTAQENFYTFYIKFLTGKNRIHVFTEKIEIPVNLLMPGNTGLKDTYKPVFDRFNNFILTLKELQKKNPPNKSQYMIRSADIANIEHGLASDALVQTQLSHLVDNNQFHKVKGFKISDDLFWEKDNDMDEEAGQLFGTDFAALVTDEINNRGATNLINFFNHEQWSPGQYLQVRARYDRGDSASKEFRITLVYSLMDIPYSEHVLIFESGTLETEKIKQNIKGMIVHKIITDMEKLFSVDITKKEIHLPHTRLTNFLMPGYGMKFRASKDNSALSFWNYSNLIFLGITFISEGIYISSGYDTDLDALYYAGLTSAGLFAVNGLLGIYFSDK